MGEKRRYKKNPMKKQKNPTGRELIKGLLESQGNGYTTAL